MAIQRIGMLPREGLGPAPVLLDLPGLAWGADSASVPWPAPARTPADAVPTRSEEVVRSVLARYPQELRTLFARDVRRQTWQLDVVRSVASPGATVVDVGGATSLFAPACAAAGFDTVLVDDQLEHSPAGPLSAAKKKALDEVIRPLGVKIMERDVLAEGLGLPARSLDVFTSFGVLEHLHHSPKAVLHQMMRALRPGGSFFVGTPNCANLRKRITALFGRAKWTQMEDWYERPVFRGHVREPDVDDLLYIARDLELVEPRVFGRNWIGYDHSSRAIRALTHVVDGVLRLRPTLCSDIYVLARKPAPTSSLHLAAG